MNTYDAKVLADNVSPDEIRLTTLQATFPRFILAEVNTHRVLSRNSASSRAIPPEKQIARVRNLDTCFVPETFLHRVKGMGGGAPLDDEAMKLGRETWRWAAMRAVEAAERLVELDVDKARVNRLLEPFLWHTAIISATEWSNFFALRDHPDAQPEFRIVARMMREAMEASDPLFVDYGQWALPLTPDFPHDDFDGDWEPWKRTSAGRCARVSFDTQDQYEPPEMSVPRAERLMGSGHFSPLEHPARPFTATEWAERRNLQQLMRLRPETPERDLLIDQLEFSGNLRGWVQMRAEVPGQNDFSQIREKETAGA